MLGAEERRTFRSSLSVWNGNQQAKFKRGKEKNIKIESVFLRYFEKVLFGCLKLFIIDFSYINIK
ncbi:hypothetical protein DFO73_11592 [Cytobacillus oceanisediminis]|uniref:Uncharacterized protein n=1 Tax=Cytobacillus oceanisediminis TaxID=665099 RepID=A0A2V2ZKQ2_9BACI|nr:hypothetical protein DFO73_11592 [Cytobacillus oceanisediminis]